MAMSSSQQALLKKLKKQVSILQRREEQGRARLRAAVKEARRLAKSYKKRVD